MHRLGLSGCISLLMLYCCHGCASTDCRLADVPADGDADIATLRRGMTVLEMEALMDDLGAEERSVEVSPDSHHTIYVYEMPGGEDVKCYVSRGTVLFPTVMDFEIDQD
jgi:hypothetical protein